MFISSDSDGLTLPKYQLIHQYEFMCYFSMVQNARFWLGVVSVMRSTPARVALVSIGFAYQQAP